MDQVNLRLSRAFCDYLMSEDENDEMKKKKLQYVTQSILGDGEKLLILIFSFLLFHQFLPFLICGAAVALVRPYLGGLHGNNFEQCLIYTYAVFLIAVYGGAYISLSAPLSIGICLIQYLIVLLYAPIQSKKRPTYPKKKRLEMKVKALIGVTITLCLAFFVREHRDVIFWFFLSQQIEIVITVIQKNGRKTIS